MKKLVWLIVTSYHDLQWVYQHDEVAWKIN